MSNGQTVWEQPAELTPSTASGMPLSKAKTNSSTDIVASWRELTAASGRKYYYNAATKVSMWEMPREYGEYLERVKDPASLDKEVLEEKFLTMLKERVRTAKTQALSVSVCRT